MSIIIAICETPCGLYEECSAPNNCTCIAGRTENGTACNGNTNYLPLLLNYYPIFFGPASVH